MRKHTNNSFTQYALIVFLGAVMIFGQAFKFHMHTQHNGMPSPTTSHIIAVHPASLLDSLSFGTYHEDTTSHHHSTEIDISLDSVANTIDLFDLFGLVFLVSSLLLCIPLLRITTRLYIQNNILTPLNFLLSPPLRAPPL